MGENFKGKDSLMKRLLSSAAISHADYSSGVPSPSSDSSEDSSSKYISFLKQVAYQAGLELNVVTIDHAYSKSSDCHSENTHTQPTKTLFFNHVPSQRETKNADDNIDVEDDSDKDSPAPFYNLQAVKSAMGECEAYISSVKAADDVDDWEERVNRMGWSNVQIRVYAKMVHILDADRRARLTLEGHPNEPMMRRHMTDKSARRMRRLLASYCWEMRIVQWLHLLLLEHLNTPYLAIYLDILQTMRAKIPVLVDKMIATSSAVSRPGLSGLESLNVVLKPPWDPVGNIINDIKPRRLPGNPILLMVPSAPLCTSAPTQRQKIWENYFSMLGTVASATVKLDPESNKVTMPTCLDQMMCATRVKVAHLRAEYPGKHIILIGWNSGATAACHIALVEPVTAVVCFGFAVNTVEGKRGQPNDTLLDLPTPVLFVIGDKALTTQRADLEDMRGKMRVETGLIVVGGADDHLRVSSTKMISKGITQSMVDRCILDEVGNFLGGILMYPRPVSMRSNPGMSGHMSLDHQGNGSVKLEKRKISSSEVATKRFRPATPVHATVHPVMTSTATSTPTSKSTLTTLPTLVSVSATKGPRQKPRITAAQKLQANPGSPETKWAGQQQGGSNPDQTTQGITLNIGSLGSLTPIGPIRLNQTASSSSSTSMQPLSDGTSLTIQGNLISEKTPTSQSPSKVSETTTLTSLSSLLQGNQSARIMVSSAPSTGQQIKGMGSEDGEASSSAAGGRVRTASGRMLDLSKLTVLTPTSSGNVVMLADSPRAPLLVPVSSVASPFTLVPLASKSGRPSVDRSTTQRSYTVIPKITVPSLKLNTPVSQAAETEKEDEDVLSAAKILELPIIFAKDGEDPILTEDKLGPESLESPTVVPISSCGSGESSSTVTLGDTISFPLESEPESEKTKSVPNVFIIRSKNSREKPPPKQSSRIKYTKIILTNRNSAGKTEGSISVRQEQPGPSDNLDDSSVL